MRRLGMTIALVVLLAGFSTSPNVSNAQIALKGHTTAHFVLIHGLAHGAWCWYKVATLLQEYGFEVTTIDLASAGRDKTVADTVLSAEAYNKPLTDFLDNFTTGQVIIVGHSLGGLGVSIASEKYSSKIAKAIYLTALMPKNDETVLSSIPPTLFAAFLETDILRPNFANSSDPSQITSYALGENMTGAIDIFYNLSPQKDVTLAHSLLVTTPHAPLFQKVFLTPSNYGSVRRFYIIAGKDRALPLSTQLGIIANNPPERTFLLGSSDHSGFFSVPRKLSHLLAHISVL